MYIDSIKAKARRYCFHRFLHQVTSLRHKPKLIGFNLAIYTNLLLIDSSFQRSPLPLLSDRTWRGIPMAPFRYNSKFFKKAWDVVGKDATESVLKFLHTGKLLKQVNATNIALVPEVDVPSNAADFRPIACCNTLYKCISKMKCERLKHILPILVNPNQDAFVQGRSIVHNVLISQELIRM